MSLSSEKLIEYITQNIKKFEELKDYLLKQAFSDEDETALSYYRSKIDAYQGSIDVLENLLDILPDFEQK